jgi:hypothetical protein
VRICPGQLSSSTRLPSVAPSSDVALAVHDRGLDAGQRQRRRAGLLVDGAGSGVIRMPPVSVCHQVSTMGQRSSPTTR